MEAMNPFSAKKGTIILLICFSLALILSISEAHADNITLIPDSEGQTLEYLPSEGIIHYTLVSDSDDFTYVYTSTKAKEDYWGIENTSEVGRINNVTVFLRVRHDTAGEEFRVAIYTYGSVYDNGADIQENASWVDYNYTWTENPSTGQLWTWEEIDALQIGIISKALGGWKGEQRVSEAWVVVDFTDLPPRWSNATINDTKVYTGESVNHSANWSDESLSGFIFSWNVSGNCDSDTWVNATWQSMTGTSNISFNISTIPTACANKTIGWRIYTNDSLDQWNVTDIRTYDVTGYGRLSVSLLTPIDQSEWTQNKTYWVNATVTCEGPTGAECGNVNGTVRYNDTTSTPDTPINTTQDTPFYITGGLSNPQSCSSSLIQGDSCQLNWSVNATGDIWSSYEIGVNFSSTTFDSSEVPDNHTSNSTIFINYTLGWLNVSLLTPIDSSEWIANKTYWVNATVTCEGSTGADCGEVNGGVRYNESGATPDTLISTAQGVIPFYVAIGSNPQSCSSLNKGDSCQLNWSVNATGSINETYEIGVNFNSSFESKYVPDNHTSNSTITIVSKYGWLNVSLLTPSESSSVVQNTTFWANATVTCEGPTGAECGNVDGGARWYNATAATYELISTATGTTPFYIVGASNPQSCSSLNEGDSCQLNWSVNATGDIWSSYDIDVNFTSSFVDVPKNNTANSTMTILGLYGWLDVTLLTPTDPSDWVQNVTYWVNATITCEGPIGGDCGNVNGTVRYNDTTSTPDTPINTTQDTPFYITGGLSNPLPCPSSLIQGDSCQLNWSVNATGSINETYEIGVNFNSSFGSSNVPDNHTSNSTVNIVDIYGWLNVSLLTPSDFSDWAQNKSYIVTANVTCRGPVGSECGTIDGGVRYNATSTTSDTLIDTAEGVIPFYISGAGISIYDFSSSTHMAEFGTNDTIPCPALDCDSLTEFADTYAAAGDGGSYPNITLAGDGSEASYDQSTPSGNLYSLHKFRFVIDEDERGIARLNISWIGYATYKATADVAYLYVWNSTDWQLVGSYTGTTPDWINESYTDSTNIANSIDETSGYLYLLAVGETYGSPKVARIATDYVEVVVEGYTNPRPCPSALDEGDTCQLSWLVNATDNADTQYEIDANFTSSWGDVPDNNSIDSTVLIIAPTWDSYTGTGCTGQSDFFNPGTTAYVCGDGFTPGNQYDVAVYDAADDRECLIGSVTADGTGRVDDAISSCTTTTTGNWHSQVFIVGGSSGSYYANDPDEIAEDLSACSGGCAFVVAVPEFGYMVIPLTMSGMMYLLIRRRFSNKHHVGLI